MLLKDIIQGLDIINTKGDLNIDISGIAYDSRKAKEGYIFVCIDGTKVDGHKFISSAIENGARALLVQKDVDVPENVSVIKIKNTRYGLAHISDAFFDHPSSKLRIIGVTGTKGKTTITYMIKSILECAKEKVGLIGTISNMIGDEVLYTERTTPESYDLQSLFYEMIEKKVDTVAMEVSSQGLQLHRVSCCKYDVGVFTNISRAHIGPTEHKDFDEYLEAKAKLFRMCEKGLVNIDSPYAQRIIGGSKCKIVTFGIEKEADIRAVNIKKYPDSVEFKVITPWTSEQIKVSIPGSFTVYNALAAIGACALMNISFDCIRSGFKNISVPGRVEVLDIKSDYTVMIDYAHSPDSLKNILMTAKEFAPARLVCLFGCGGDRDRSMRPMMGKISGSIADFTIITSDNPRTEDPESIISDIEEGIKSTEGEYIKIVDREEAIRFALKNAKPKDIIILAGKGHENYITFKDKTIHFDEREVVKKVLEEIQ